MQPEGGNNIWTVIRAILFVIFGGGGVVFILYGIDRYPEFGGFVALVVIVVAGLWISKHWRNWI